MLRSVPVFSMLLFLACLSISNGHTQTNSENQYTLLSAAESLARDLNDGFYLNEISTAWRKLGEQERAKEITQSILKEILKTPLDEKTNFNKISSHIYDILETGDVVTAEQLLKHILSDLPHNMSRDNKNAALKEFTSVVTHKHGVIKNFSRKS